MGSLTIATTPIAGMFRVQGTRPGDERGRFSRLFCERELAAIRPNLHFRQINLSETDHAGTVRGMHFQRPPAAEAKLIRCLRGRVFDVAVDLRAGSPTFLHWHAIELSGDEDVAVFIPEGMAHGFQSLTDDAHLLYMHTAEWTPACESGLRYDDARVGVKWPMKPARVSERDRSFPVLGHDFAGVTA
jgi:dTDP-4-dehydrorhamnose 3,5-epimerase